MAVKVKSGVALCENFNVTGSILFMWKVSTCIKKCTQSPLFGSMPLYYKLTEQVNALLYFRKTDICHEICKNFCPLKVSVHTVGRT